MNPAKPVTEPLLKALEAWPESQADIARALGVRESVVSRVRRRIGTPGGDTIDALAAFLGLELRPVRASKRAGKPGPAKKGVR